MFSLDHIEISNFRSYYGEHKFVFPKASGLYFLRGENLAESTLGANGAGKSTFLDAITWCLYGRTTRELKANDVLSWLGPGSCRVVLTLTVGSKQFKVKRSQKPNHLILIIDGIEKPVDQEELQKHLRLNYRSFLYSVLNTQFGESFFSLLPSAKLTLFSEIKELDLWLERSKSATARAADLERDIRGFESVIAQHQGKISTIEEDLKTLWDGEGKFEATRAARHASIKKDLRKNEVDLEHHKSRLQQIKWEKGQHHNDLARAVHEENEANLKRDDILDKIQTVSREKSNLLARKEVFEERAERLQSLSNVCHTCEQAVSDAYKHGQVVTILGKTFKQLTDAIDRASVVAQGLTANLVKVKSEVEVATVAAQEARLISSDIDIKITKRKAQIAATETLIAGSVTQLKSLHEEVNPYSKMLDAKKVQLRAFKKVITESTETKNTLEAELSAVEYWVKGFKRVRLFIIEQAFQQLEIEVNNCLVQLGMPDWHVTFDIERENKSGGVTKGFVAFIKGPANKEPVRWESWSGGETQRLQLAGNLGLANLIMQQAGLTSNIEMYDEPSTHLSGEGMTDLANMLHERAVGEGKRIWIVDHTSMTNFGEFKDVITVRKSSKGSTISVD